MAFENISTSSLKSALNSCKNGLNYSDSKYIISSISNETVWQSDSKRNLKNALETLINNRYKDLEIKIDNYLRATELIEKYQELEKHNKTLDSEYSGLKNKLYYTETYTTTSTGSDGNPVTEKHTRTVKDYSVERKINNNRSIYNDNKTTMDTLKSNVSNLI